MFSHSCFIELILPSATKTNKILVTLVQHTGQGASLRVRLMRKACYPFTYAKFGW